MRELDLVGSRVLGKSREYIRLGIMVRKWHNIYLTKKRHRDPIKKFLHPSISKSDRLSSPPANPTIPSSRYTCENRWPTAFGDSSIYLSTKFPYIQPHPTKIYIYIPHFNSLLYRYIIQN